MLNELLVVERGLSNAEIIITSPNSAIKGVGKKPTLRVRLNSKGQVADVDPVPKDISLWTFGKGNKQRFPFVQPNVPLMHVQNEEMRSKLEGLPYLRAEKRRISFLELCRDAIFNESSLTDWPGTRNKNGGWSQNPQDYLNGLKERRDEIQGLQGTDGESVVAAVERFLTACTKTGGGVELLRQIIVKFIDILQYTADDEWLRVGQPLLFLGGGALFFDVPSQEFSRLAGDPRQVEAISKVLKIADKGDGLKGKCALSGEDGVVLVKDTFPELVIRPIGKMILFSRFDAIPSNARYGNFGAKSFSAGQNIVEKLAGSFQLITAPEREGLTWRGIPGEIPKQSDLLIAFVREAIDAPVVGLLTEKSEDFSEEEANAVVNQAGTVAAFEQRTKRLLEAVEANVSADWRKVPVSIAIFRKVDTANSKVIYSGTSDVSTMYDAAIAWIAGERNIPQELSAWVLDKDGFDPRPMKPFHVAPLGLTKFSKQIFLRNGRRPPGKKKEQVGLPAVETLRLFLDGARKDDRRAELRASRILRLVLARRTALIAEVSHSQCRGLNSYQNYDFYEALRTITILGVLLHKLNQEKEVYMSGTAFRLGQLLAVVDVVHAGYCFDVRGGAIPPSLLGNQVFVMAQTAPVKALATLCRRWKPYAGWARKNNTYQMPDRFTNDQGQWKKRAELKTEAEREDFDKAAAIVVAVSQGRKVASITDKLAGQLPNQCDDIFRAELLLGYMTGIPRNQREDDEQENLSTSKEG